MDPLRSPAETTVRTGAAGARHPLAVTALVAMTLLSLAGCTRVSSFPLFEREQQQQDLLPDSIRPPSDIDLESTRLVGVNFGVTYYLAQDSIPGSPAVCLMIVRADDPQGSSSTCGRVPLSAVLQDKEVRVVYPSAPTPEGWARLDDNVMVHELLQTRFTG